MNFPESADKDRHLMRYTLLQEKNHHMAFLSQFWPLSDHMWPAKNGIRQQGVLLLLALVIFILFIQPLFI